MSKKKKNDIIVTFIGESSNDVTGSSILVHYPKHNGEYGNILIEMGLVQGESTIEKDLAVNRRMLQKFNKELIESIEYVFICHSHSDHQANLPYLDTGRFKGKIFIPQESVPIVQDLMDDSVGIHLNNVRRLKELRGKKIKPFYNKENMINMFDKMVGVEKYNKIKLNDEIEFEFINSGHVLGGCMLKLWITKPNNSKKLLIYTSDMGSNYNNQFQYFVPPREQINKCNLLISEATYCNPYRSWSKKDATNERKQLKEDIKSDLLNGKEILMSAFSFGRVQNLICMLYDMFYEEEWFDYDIILDGVLLHKINYDYTKVLKDDELKYFNKVLNWKHIKLNKTYDGTLALMSKKQPRIIISTSGFLSQGRIMSWLQHLIPSSKSTIYITGYCGDENSIGYRLLNPNQKTITIDKQVLLKRATIKQLKTFSSHIQYNELISLFKGINCDNILIHHSDKEEKIEFVDEVKKELNKIGKITKIKAITVKDNQFKL